MLANSGEGRGFLSPSGMRRLAPTAPRHSPFDPIGISDGNVSYWHEAEDCHRSDAPLHRCTNQLSVDGSSARSEVARTRTCVGYGYVPSLKSPPATVVLSVTKRSR